MEFESYAKLMHRSLKLRTEIIIKWSTWFLDHVADSLEGDLALELAYLWPAILKGQKINVTHESAIVLLLRRFEVPEDEKIWDYLSVDAE